MKRIVLTGGTYAGKTTLVNEFKNQGFTIVPEASIQIISELQEKYGVEYQKKWMMENYTQFQIMNAKRQIELEKNVQSGKGDVVFYDRGLFDYFAFCILRGYEIPSEILSMADKVCYDIAFVCSTLSSFDMRSDTGRTIDKETSLRLVKITHDIYTERVRRVINVDEMSLEDRIHFIKTHL